MTEIQVGQRIIDAIISGALVRSECVEDNDHGVLTVWREHAAEQIGALVRGLADKLCPPIDGQQKGSET